MGFDKCILPWMERECWRLNMTGKMTKVGLAASAVSIAASIYIYFSYNGGDEMLGIFVGLWAPTLILYAQELDKLSE
ncbi:MAG: hypothetical protein CMA78_03945 [Euryarchaeota archaeon]|nr:hypothetical protein [Euryarchaeota archaeon]